MYNGAGVFGWRVSPVRVAAQVRVKVRLRARMRARDSFCLARMQSRGECEGYQGFGGGMVTRCRGAGVADLGYRLRLGWPG